MSGVAGSGVVAAILVFWIKSYFGPYLTQKAKNLATHEDIQKLIDQVRETETVKAEISHGVWDRQTRLLAKRDLYVEIAEALGTLRDLYVTMKGLELLRLTASFGQQAALVLDEKRKQKQQELEQAILKLHGAQDAAPLMIPDEPYKPLRDFRPRKIGFNTPNWEQDFEYNIASTQWTLYHFQTAARADMGFDPMVWKPTTIGATPPPEP